MYAYTRTQYVWPVDRGDGTSALATVIMPISRCGGGSRAGISEVRAKNNETHVRTYICGRKQTDVTAAAAVGTPWLRGGESARWVRQGCRYLAWWGAVGGAVIKSVGWPRRSGCRAELKMIIIIMRRRRRTRGRRESRIRAGSTGGGASSCSRRRRRRGSGGGRKEGRRAAGRRARVCARVAPGGGRNISSGRMSAAFYIDLSAGTRLADGRRSGPSPRP